MTSFHKSNSTRSKVFNIDVLVVATVRQLADVSHNNKYKHFGCFGSLLNLMMYGKPN